MTLMRLTLSHQMIMYLLILLQDQAPCKGELTITECHAALSQMESCKSTCAVPGRSIFKNLFLLQDTIDFVQHKRLPPAIISLDKEKAFDRVNHNFLQRILEKFNLGPDFRRWVQVDLHGYHILSYQ